MADKGETTGMFGRTVSVIENETGRQLATLFSSYQVDHLLLAPNGKEFWATSNAEGRIYETDAATREQTHIIDMPQFGDPHGLVWVHYNENGQSKVVRDQGGFHNGINPHLATRWITDGSSRASTVLLDPTHHGDDLPPHSPRRGARSRRRSS